jgi:hypothetical protein
VTKAGTGCSELRLRATEKLSEDLRQPGCLKLVGEEDQWRVRVGDWQVMVRASTHPTLASGKTLVLVLHLRADHVVDHYM